MNGDKHVIAREYDIATFKQLYQKYFPEHINRWFELDYEKIHLTIDNTKPRVFTTEDKKNHLNLFAGYKFSKDEPKDLAKIASGKDGVAFVWEHILKVWNSGNKQFFEYDQKWIRKMVFGYKMTTMLYIKGKMGTGKTAVVEFLTKVLGENVCLTVTNDNVFTGDFNGPLLGKCLVCLDEIVHDYTQFKSLYNKLKPYITSPTQTYRNLFQSLKTMSNLMSCIMCGNYDMLKLDDPTKGDDRRTKINDVSNTLQSI
jgi:Cdc6-like AAA superfamily ATPase